MRIREALRWSGKPLGAGALVGAVALTIGAVVPAIAQSSGTGAAPPLALRQPSHRHDPYHLDHVFIIMLENHAPKDLIDDPKMPFLTSLAKENGRANRYYGVTHTSEPNYIAATSGSTWWTNDDDGWYSGNHYPNPHIAGNHYPHRNIVDLLESRHIRWAAYMEAMPKAGYLPDSWPNTTGVSPLYVSKHDPFILYNDVRLNRARRDQIKPYSQMSADLNSPKPPRYVWISPDLCNDLHGGVTTKIAGHPETPCPYSNKIGDRNDEALKAKADAFLHHAVNTIRHSRAWTGNSVIFIVADETDFDAAHPKNGDYLSTAGCCDSPYLPAGDPEISKDWPGGRYGGGLVPAIVVSRNGPRHVVDSVPYNHYSMLRTIEEGFGLAHLGYTSDTSQVHAMWPLIVRQHSKPRP